MTWGIEPDHSACIMKGPEQVALGLFRILKQTHQESRMQRIIIQGVRMALILASALALTGCCFHTNHKALTRSAFETLVLKTQSENTLTEWLYQGSDSEWDYFVEKPIVLFFSACDRSRIKSMHGVVSIPPRRIYPFVDVSTWKLPRAFGLGNGSHSSNGISFPHPEDGEK